MAERVGFEPTIRLRVYRFSRPAYSTTLAPLRLAQYVPSIRNRNRFCLRSIPCGGAILSAARARSNCAGLVLWSRAAHSEGCEDRGWLQQPQDSFHGATLPDGLPNRSLITCSNDRFAGA